MAMLFELKKNKLVFLALALALLCCIANIAYITGNCSQYREPMKQLSEVARISGTNEITEDFQQNYYRLVTVPKLERIQIDSGRTVAGFTGITEGTFEFDRFPEVRDAFLSKTLSPDFFTADDSTRRFADKVLSLLTEFDNTIYSQKGRSCFPDDGSTGFAGTYAVLKSAVFAECFCLTTLVFALCCLNEKNSRSETFELLFSTLRGKRIFNVKILEILIFSVSCWLIVAFGTSIFHYNYFDYSPFLHSSIESAFFFSGMDRVELIIPGMTFFQYYLATLLFLLLTLLTVFFLLAGVFVLAKARPIYVLITAAAMTALFLLATILAGSDPSSPIPQIYPYPAILAGNTFILKVPAADGSTASGPYIRTAVFALYLIVSAVFMFFCLMTRSPKSMPKTPSET